MGARCGVVNVARRDALEEFPVNRIAVWNNRPRPEAESNDGTFGRFSMASGMNIFRAAGSFSATPHTSPHTRARHKWYVSAIRTEATSPVQPATTHPLLHACTDSTRSHVVLPT